MSQTVEIDQVWKFKAMDRPRLQQRIASEMVFRLVLLSAPAGFGKSTLMWNLSGRMGVRARVLRLRKEHSELQKLGDELRALLGVATPSTLPVSGANLTDDLVADLANFNGTIVLDEVHVLESRSTSFLVDLIERSPSSVQWILATRSHDRLPVATWISRAELGKPILQADLRLTAEELRGSARALKVALDDDVASQVLALSKGWPVIAFFFLSSLEKYKDLQKAAHEATDLLYAFLEEQVFAGLSGGDKRFLLRTSLLPSLDLDALYKAGFREAAASLSRIKRKTALVERVADREFAYEELFQKYLVNRVKLLERGTYASILCRTGEVLEATGLVDRALWMYAQAENSESVTRCLIQYGRTLIERGYLEEIRSLLFSTWFGPSTDVVELVGLKAEILGKLGHFEESNALFASALSRSSADDRADISQRFAASLINQYRHHDACRVLRAIRLATITDPDLRCRGYATLAAAQSASGRHKLAARSMQQALELAYQLNNASLEATVLNSGAFVSIRAGDLDSARLYALRSITVAEQSGLNNIAARAYSTLASLSSEAGDQESTFESCSRMLEFAERTGDRSVARVALMGLCDVATERGEGRRFEELEAKVDLFEGRNEPRWHETLLPAKAMQLAWRGSFHDACDLLEASSYQHANTEQQLLRRAEMALYAAAAGRREVARVKLAESEPLEEDIGGAQPFSNRVVKAGILLALSYALVSQPQTAVQRLRELERRRMLRTPALYAFWRAAMLFSCSTEAPNDIELNVALQEVESRGLGGFAMLLASLRTMKRGVTHRLSSLTPTERNVLQRLAQGQTSKAIAFELKRSPETIDTHVKSILRKLACNGRIDAARIAREHGLA